MNANAVRPHAQVYPRFYLDMADEMGICVLNETANWASDGGPKLDSDLFWEASKEHLKRFCPARQKSRVRFRLEYQQRKQTRYPARLQSPRTDAGTKEGMGRMA